MFCRNISWLLLILVAVVTATDYNDPDLITEPSKMEPNGEDERTRAVDLGALLDARHHAMVTLVAGDTRLVVHRAVLAARSHVFAAMLEHGALAGNRRKIRIPNMTGPTLRQLVAYFYTLQPPQMSPHLPLAHAPPLLDAADRYGLPALKADCERQLAARLTVENAAVMAIIAVRHPYDSLRKAAIQFIRAHLEQVVFSQRWADGIRLFTEDMFRVSQLLSQLPAETSSPPSADSVTASYPDAHVLSHHSSHSSPPASSACSTSSVNATAVSRLQSLSEEDKGWRLIRAAKRGSVDKLKELLAAGADLAATDGDRDVDMDGDWYRRTALHWAVYYGHVDAVRFLVVCGVRVDIEDNWQNTPLHWAAYLGRAAVVRLLTAYSADTDARDKAGWTPLHLAASQGHTEAATALLEAGADKLARNGKGDTPLAVARQYHRQQMMDLLR